MWRGNVHKTNRTNYVVMMIFTFPTRQLPISSHVRGCDETFFSTRNFPCGKSQKNLARCCPSKKTVMTSWTSILQEQKPAKKTNINRPKKNKPWSPMACDVRCHGWFVFMFALKRPGWRWLNTWVFGMFMGKEGSTDIFGHNPKNSRRTIKRDAHFHFF